MDDAKDESTAYLEFLNEEVSIQADMSPILLRTGTIGTHVCRGSQSLLTLSPEPGTEAQVGGKR